MSAVDEKETGHSHQRRGRIWPVSVAPMMEWTDRHYRFFMRQISRHTLLYTQMKTTGAVLRGNREKVLAFSELEKPLALQLGGDDPVELAESARIAQDMGYDEVNLNIGCPSDRVQSGNFGACLMARPSTVAAGVAAMRRAVSLPVTVKHRIGIDDLQRYEDMAEFVRIVAEAGCDRFTVHSRIAWLKGLSPRENRSVPPLRYEDVYRLKADFPHLIIEINGGINSAAAVMHHLQQVDGVMIGRAAYENPFLFACFDQQFYGAPGPAPTRREVLDAMIPYIERWRRDADVYPNRIIRHMLGLFAHQRGARAWKRYLSENVHLPGTTAAILRDAAAHVPAAILDERPQPLAEPAVS